MYIYYTGYYSHQPEKTKQTFTKLTGQLNAKSHAGVFYKMYAEPMGYAYLIFQHHVGFNPNFKRLV